MIERRGARVIHVLPKVCGTCFRKLRHYHGMVKRAGRLLFQLFKQLGVRAGQFAQAEHRQAIEQGFEHGQNGQKEHGGHDSSQKAVAHLLENFFDPRDGRRRTRTAARKSGDLQKEDDKIDGNDDNQSDTDDLETGLCLIAEENGNHARGKSDDEGRIDVIGSRGPVGEIIDDEH